MQLTWLAIAIVATVLHMGMAGSTTLREALPQLDWTAVALAATIGPLDLGFLMLYRAGFSVSLVQLVTQSAASCCA